MSKTVMIVQPTTWMKPREIQKERTRIAKALMRKGYIVLNAKWEGRNISNNSSSKLFMLGNDVQKLGLADCVLFCDEWRDDAGCCALHYICTKYKKNTMTEEDIFTEDYS